MGKMDSKQIEQQKKWLSSQQNLILLKNMTTQFEIIMFDDSNYHEEIYIEYKLIGKEGMDCMHINGQDCMLECAQFFANHLPDMNNLIDFTVCHNEIFDSTWKFPNSLQKLYLPHLFPEMDLPINIKEVELQCMDSKYLKYWKLKRPLCNFIIDEMTD